MSSMTKEQLKAELISHGAPVPSSSRAKKEEYEKLYREHVENSGYFSSDDENVNNESDPVTTSSTTSNVANGTSEVTQENIGDLSDAELYELLVKYSINAGPIVASTRPFYEKILLDKMKKTIVSGTRTDQLNGNNVNQDHVGNGNGFSSDEEAILADLRKRKSVTPKKDKSVRRSYTPAPKSWDDEETNLAHYSTSTRKSVTPTKPGTSSAATSRRSETPKSSVAKGIRQLGTSKISAAAGSRQQGVRPGEITPPNTASRTPEKSEQPAPTPGTPVLPSKRGGADIRTDLLKGRLIQRSSEVDSSTTTVEGVYKLDKKSPVVRKEDSNKPEGSGTVKYILFAVVILLASVIIYYLYFYNQELSADEKIDREMEEAIKRAKDTIKKQ